MTTPGLRVERLRAEHRADALGIGTATPRLSWLVTSAPDHWRQAGYEVEATSPAADRSPASDDRQTRGPAAGADPTDSVLVPWPFAPLRSRQRVAVRVRVVGADGNASDWSEPLAVEAGLLDPTNWSAALVTHPDDGVLDDTADAGLDRLRPLRFRRRFDVAAPGAEGRWTHARLHITACGVYTAELNGETIGDHVLAPGWTSYRHRHRYQTFDVTDLLRPGANALGITVAEGWYRGRLAWVKQRIQYGGHIGPVAQLELLDDHDAVVHTVATDDAWQVATGPVLTASLYDGEDHDARLDRPGWSTPDAVDDDDADGWRPVAIAPFDHAVLVAADGPPVRRVEELAPVAVTTAPSGRTVVDFGQNLAGRVRLRAEAPAGTTVTIRHAEVLADGELATEPLRTARCADRYTFAGTGVETWEPSFTIHGFRYVDVDGWPGDVAGLGLRAVVCHSDLEPAGALDVPDPLLARLHENVRWSAKGNFVDIPTDCPQRDERLGWTGDIQVFAPAATFLFDCAGFLRSWLADVAVEQAEHGTVPHFVPYLVTEFDLQPAAAWGDAAVVVPWVLHERYGDVEVLRRQYPSMRAWVERVTEACSPDGRWDEGFQFGDWLDPAAPADNPFAARTEAGIVATAYHARTAALVADAARLLGAASDDAPMLAADAERFDARAALVRDAFVAGYVDEHGRMTSDAPTAYALAIAFDLLATDEQRAGAGRRLVELVEAEGFHVGTGFVGTPLICDALTAVGAVDHAYGLLAQRGCPSWLYPVTQGATTIWERWDSLRPDGAVNSSGMTSFNHYAYGAVADFLHRVVAGLAPAAPGYRRVRFAPRPGGGLAHAGASLRTPYGDTSIRWERHGDALVTDVVVPTGASGVVALDGRPDAEVGPGHHRFESPVRPAADDPAFSRFDGSG